jgi:hypothetical protein
MAHATGVSDGSILLTLTPDEADMLAAVLGKIGGSPSDSPRRHQESIRNALRRVGLNYDSAASWPLLSGHLRFGDYPRPAEPEFTPGYFQDTGDDEVRWFESEPRAFSNGEWVRVNIVRA